ncbi:MAG TPA: hypothetical protein VFT22_25495 [Kofleriaceae bacterium]|nr:hypothetical protein [Kofleriaceae bacterium]
MSTENESGTGLTLALVGGGAFLLWLLWPGRGRGQGGRGDKDAVSARKAVHVRIRSGDQVFVDGINMDLATVLARAREAGTAYVLAAGDARQGWVETVFGALQAAGIHTYRVKESGVEAYQPPGALPSRNARSRHLPGRRVPVEAHTRSWPRHGR